MKSCFQLLVLPSALRATTVHCAVIWGPSGEQGYRALIPVDEGCFVAGVAGVTNSKGFLKRLWLFLLKTPLVCASKPTVQAWTRFSAIEPDAIEAGPCFRFKYFMV